MKYHTPKKPIKVPMPKDVVSPDDFKISTGDIERAKKKYLAVFGTLADKIDFGIGSKREELEELTSMMETILKF